MSELGLPELIYLNDYSGNYEAYIAAVYEVFRRDFVVNRPLFQGVRLRLKCHPYFQDREYTFYHITHEGDQEDQRIPDLRRCERIGYARVLIENADHPSLKVWRQVRNGKNRIAIYHEEESYLVILDDRSEYILLWTAFYVRHNSFHKKLMKEYEEYIKNQNRPG